LSISPLITSASPPPPERDIPPPSPLSYGVTGDCNKSRREGEERERRGKVEGVEEVVVGEGMGVRNEKRRLRALRKRIAELAALVEAEDVRALAE